MSDLAITFKNDGAWGTGVHRNLTSAEGDGNNWEIKQAVEALQTDRPLPAEISSISVNGRFMTIQLSSGASFGPFPLPITEFRYREEWQPFTVYDPLDWFTVAGVGIFTVIYSHTSGSTFDPNIEADDLPALTKIAGADLTSTANSTVYDLEFIYPGYLSDIDGPLNFLAPRKLIVPVTGPHFAYITAAAASVDQVLEILHNETVIGHVTFLADDNQGTVQIIADEPVEPGDRIALGPPAAPDGTAKQMTVALAMQRVLTT